jgi:hypothetical protein
MDTVFVITNQHGHYWAKAKVWADGSDARSLWRSEYRDDAVNTLVELSTKDFELRGHIFEAQLNPRGEPLVTASDVPLSTEGNPDLVAESNGA